MSRQRVLVSYASERGSTAEIAEAVAEILLSAGLQVDLRPVSQVRDVTPYRAVVLGSAVYMMRWRREAVRFLRRHRKELAERVVWLFQSGPLDDSAETQEIPLPKSVIGAAAAAGVRGHATFGGKLAPDASGFIASKMARGEHSGDFRNFEQIRVWAGRIAEELGNGKVARASG